MKEKVATNSLVNEKLIRENARFINSSGEKCKIIEIEGNLVIYEKCKDKDKHNSYFSIGKEHIRKTGHHYIKDLNDIQ